MIPSILRAAKRPVRDLVRNLAFFVGLVVAVAPLTGCWTDIPLDAASDNEPLDTSAAPAETAASLDDSVQTISDASSDLSVGSNPAEPSDEPVDEPVDGLFDGPYDKPANVTLPPIEVEQDDLFANVPSPAAENEQMAENDTVPLNASDETSADTASDNEPSDLTGDLFGDVFGAKPTAPENLETSDIPEVSETSQVDDEPSPVNAGSLDMEDSTEPTDDDAAAAGDADVVTSDAPTNSLLPWETESDTTVAEHEVGATDIAVPIDGLTWETPTDAAEGGSENTAETEGSANSVEPDHEPWNPSDAAPSQPLDTRSLAWQLGSRLSYLLIAPDTDLAAARDELQPVAESLSIRLPQLDAPAANATQRLKRLLAVGRELGSQVDKKYGADHAALVEMAFKSNMLLAIIEDRPHLRHAVNGSVAAAAVRSGLPETIWKPWQDRIAKDETTSEIASAVVDLHTQVGDFLKRSRAEDTDAMPPVLR